MADFWIMVDGRPAVHRGTHSDFECSYLNYDQDGEEHSLMLGRGGLGCPRWTLLTRCSGCRVPLDNAVCRMSAPQFSSIHFCRLCAELGAPGALKEAREISKFGMRVSS